jgi:hypothetical protein
MLYQPEAEVSTIYTALVAGGFVVLGALITQTVTFLLERRRAGEADKLERRRAAEADRWRDHEQRARAAEDFLVRFDAYRRDVRDRPDRSDNSGRDLKDAVGRVKLFFEDDVVTLAKTAQSTVYKAMKDEQRKSFLLDRAETEREHVIDAMRRTLRSPPRPRPPMDSGADA